MRILLLGGTTEAMALLAALASVPHVTPILSLAGRTRAPDLPPTAYRLGGFGGVDGLRAYLRAEAIDRVIDATHPFAEQMTRNAVAACEGAGIPLARFTRPPWSAQPGDIWQRVATMPDAARALGTTPRRVFLTIGRLQVAAFEAAPQHAYLLRIIDPPDPLPALPHLRLLPARGPFTEAADRDLMQRERIEVLVSKNSGGAATYGKIAAARSLGVPVIMVAPPPDPSLRQFHDLAAVLDWLHRPAP